MYMPTDHKIIYCYYCKSNTIYHHRDTHGNSHVESHCSECGWMEWQNRAVEREKQKWIDYNKEHGIGLKLPKIKASVQIEDSDVNYKAR